MSSTRAVAKFGNPGGHAGCGERIKTKLCTDFKHAYDNSKLPRGTKSEVYLKCLTLATVHCTEVRFASFFSGGFITAIVVNPPEKETGKTHLCTLHCKNFY